MKPPDPSSGVPLYRQVARALQEDIAAGVLKPGDAVPSLREASAALRINVHTVAKAWQELEREGALVRERGGPYRVGQVAEAAEDLLRTDIDQLLDRAGLMGLDDETVLGLLVGAMDERQRETA
ncbi:MAG: GntR family transcriptional regulator [Myxococcota bacterium]|nr:GntR family transcriptional regulator [Myxococcota bacterium]MEC8422956.1 GntR family transcriptional regulator [Myxococcota bacterium]